MSRYLIRGGCVLTMDERVGNRREADVLIEDERIADIGSNLRVRDAEVVDASESIVMPGFVDTHRHVWESLFRGAGDLGGITDFGARLGPHHSSDDVYVATLIGLLGAVEAGITTVVDWSDVPPEHAASVLEAHADAGTRSVVAFAGAPGISGDTGWQAALGRGGGSATAVLAAAPPAPLQDPDRVGADWEWARRHGFRIHAHAGVDPTGRGEVAALAVRGLLASDVTLVHCSSLDGDDFDAIAASGASVALAPSSEMARGQEPPPVQSLIDRGIRPGLAVDSVRMAPGDLFAPMRAAISMQHATHFDLKLAGKGGLPSLLTTRQVIRYATIDGARAAGLDEVTGSLRPGKQADLIVLRADRPNIVPLNDPVGAVVWGMDTSNLDWVFVAGKPLMTGGILAADVEDASARAGEARSRISSAAGLLPRVGA